LPHNLRSVIDNLQFSPVSPLRTAAPS
jgi:hypothetical protein